MYNSVDKWISPQAAAEFGGKCGKTGRRALCTTVWKTSESHAAPLSERRGSFSFGCSVNAQRIRFIITAADLQPLRRSRTRPAAFPCLPPLCFWFANHHICRRERIRCPAQPYRFVGAAENRIWNGNAFPILSVRRQAFSSTLGRLSATVLIAFQDKNRSLYALGVTPTVLRKV